MERSLSTELATRAFDANAAFSAALAEFQAAPREESIAADVRRAAAHGFAWFARPSEVGHFQVVVRHKAGAEISADGESITATLAGLLGHPLAHDLAVLATQASEPDQEAITPGPEPRANASPAQVAAESLATATGGAIVAGPSEYVPDPDETERERLAVPLTDEQKAVCVEMVSSLGADKQKAFKIAFRDAFCVPREAKSIAPLITEVRHMEFCDRWGIEAAGGVAP
jgi:hypothetical protein